MTSIYYHRQEGERILEPRLWQAVKAKKSVGTGRWLRLSLQRSSIEGRRFRIVHVDFTLPVALAFPRRVDFTANYHFFSAGFARSNASLARTVDTLHTVTKEGVKSDSHNQLGGRPPRLAVSRGSARGG
jgi:hypothetical protein